MVVYIGNSASLSFLSSIRRIVASAIGSYKFTQDVHLSAYSHQHQMIETVSMFKCSNGTNHPPDVDVQVAAELTTHFSLATTGILDLFEHHILQAQVRRFAHSPDRACWPHHAVLYLVLALGAQARAHGQGDDYLADSYFHFGLHQAMGELVDEPSIVTVQAFCLDTWYALAACRRTVATMYLGIATQADYTIGLHRPEANVVFGAERITSREKAWTGLRFCDVNDETHPADVSTFAYACVFSAIEKIDAANGVLQQSPPRRLRLIIDSLFMAALCIGVAYFWNHDDGYPRRGTDLERAIAALVYFAPCNPQAARYVQIIRQLVKALTMH
ncbi:hypothetical protein AYO22_03479 [Fonsecaea multimorphosa]|nr:hypothetical protein AYO22_03479 [Fonsecaea multimorphosa]